MGEGGQRHAPAALPLAKITGTNSRGDWVDLRDELEICGKSRSYRDSIPGPSCP